MVCYNVLPGPLYYIDKELAIPKFFIFSIFKLIFYFAVFYISCTNVFYFFKIYNHTLVYGPIASGN